MPPAVCPTCGDYLPVQDGYVGRCENCRREGVGDDVFLEAKRPRSSEEDELRPKRRRRPEPPPRKKSRVGLVLLIIFGSMFLMCCGGGTALWFVFIREVEEPVTAADKEVMVTAEQVAKGTNIKVDTTTGKYKKSHNFAGVKEMSYEYDRSNDAITPFYVSCIVTLEKSQQGAADTYAGLGLGANIGMGTEASVQKVDRNDLWSWGDESRCVVLQNMGQPGGNLFMGRKGHRVFFLMIGGKGFNTKESIKALLDPILKKVEGYDG
jgi:hypothetical protein